ncbi:MAG TPA: phosphotransferase [Anaerolineae bacterium]
MDISASLLQAGAERFDVPPATLKLLGGMDGVVYSYARDSADYVLKFSPAKSEQIPTMLAKLDFVNYLSANGVSVSRPVPSTRGELVETLVDAGQLWAITSSELAPGRHANHAEEFGDELFQKWGQTIGLMHRLTKRYDDVRRWPTGLIEDWHGEMHFFAQWCDDDAVRQKWLALGALMGQWSPDKDCFGLIHNDLHMLNFTVSHVNGELRLTVFDFDVCDYHWFMTDIGIAVFHSVWDRWSDTAYTRAFVPHFLEQFMRGYARENTLDEIWLQRLPYFLKYRQMLLHTVFCHEWAKPTPGQAQQLADWRESIIDETPAVYF